MSRRTWFIVTLLLSITSTTLQQPTSTTTDCDYENDYYDDPQPKNQKNEEASTNVATKPEEKPPKTLQPLNRDKEEPTTEKPFAKYEVTELVIDVPDDSTKKAIFTNFTINRPLNLAGDAKINIDTVTVKDEGDEAINAIFVPDEPKDSTNKLDKSVKGRSKGFDEIDDKKFHMDHYHPKSNFDKELEDDGDEDEEHDEYGYFDYKAPPKKSFKDYFHNTKKDIVTGFKTAVNKHKDGINESLHKIVNGPISFLSKLHSKTTDFFHNFHKTASKHKCDYNYDDSGDDDYDYEY